jgi:YHS domain-containing protein
MLALAGPLLVLSLMVGSNGQGDEGDQANHESTNGEHMDGNHDHGDHMNDDHDTHMNGEQADGDASTTPPETSVIPEDYPLDVCVVSGEKLGSMGEPVVKTYDGQTVVFCCAGCVQPFEKNKEKYLAKIRQAENEQQD